MVKKSFSDEFLWKKGATKKVWVQKKKVQNLATKFIQKRVPHPAWLRSNIDENTHGRFLAPSSLETMLRKILCLIKTFVGQFFPAWMFLGWIEWRLIVSKKNSQNLCLSFCLTFLATNMLEGSDISLMKGGSHSFIRSTISGSRDIS